MMFYQLANCIFKWKRLNKVILEKNIFLDWTFPGGGETKIMRPFKLSLFLVALIIENFILFLMAGYFASKHLNSFPNFLSGSFLKKKNFCEKSCFVAKLFTTFFGQKMHFSNSHTKPVLTFHGNFSMGFYEIFLEFQWLKLSPLAILSCYKAWQLLHHWKKQKIYEARKYHSHFQKLLEISVKISSAFSIDSVTKGFRVLLWKNNLKSLARIRVPNSVYDDVFKTCSILLTECFEMGASWENSFTYKLSELQREKISQDCHTLKAQTRVQMTFLWSAFSGPKKLRALKLLLEEVEDIHKLHSKIPQNKP